MATLAELRKPGTYEQLRATGSRLRTALEEALRQAEVPAQVIGDDTIFDVYFTDQEISDYRSTLSASSETMQRFNRLLLGSGIVKGVQKFYMSLAHTEEDIQTTIQAYRDVAEQLRSG